MVTDEQCYCIVTDERERFMRYLNARGWKEDRNHRMIRLSGNGLVGLRNVVLIFLKDTYKADPEKLAVIVQMSILTQQGF